MTRGLASLNVTASQQAHVRPLLFVELQFASGTQYLHNGIGTYSWGSQTWTGVGDLGEIGPIEEGEDSPFAIELTLSGLSTSFLTIAQGVGIFERRVIIYIGFLDDSGVLTTTPDELWSGAMQTMSITLGDLNSITLTAESELIAETSANGALFTDTDQQKRYASDTGFSFLDQMLDARIQWGPGATGGMNDVARGGGGTAQPGRRFQR